jgi:hypothetical protein
MTREEGVRILLFSAKKTSEASIGKLLSDSWKTPWAPAPSESKPYPTGSQNLADNPGTTGDGKTSADRPISPKHVDLKVGNVLNHHLGIRLLPYTWAIIYFISHPFAIQWPWPRCVLTIYPSQGKNRHRLQPLPGRLKDEPILEFL